MKIRTKIASGLAAILAASVLINPMPKLQKSVYSEKPAIQKNYEVFKCKMKIINSDGSVHYSVQERNKEGKLLKEYAVPSNEKYELNPNAITQNPDTQDKPLFYSTVPRLEYPDGTIEDYRPLKPGETLDDVTKEEPLQKYNPQKPLDGKLTFDSNSFEPGNYMTLIEREDRCDNIYDIYGTLGGKFNVKSNTPQCAITCHEQITDWISNQKNGIYELHVKRGNCSYRLGTIQLNKGDKVKFIKE